MEIDYSGGSQGWGRETWEILLEEYKLLVII